MVAIDEAGSVPDEIPARGFAPDYVWRNLLSFSPLRVNLDHSKVFIQVQVCTILNA